MLAESVGLVHVPVVVVESVHVGANEAVIAGALAPADDGTNCAVDDGDVGVTLSPHQTARTAITIAMFLIFVFSLYGRWHCRSGQNQGKKSSHLLDDVWQERTGQAG